MKKIFHLFFILTPICVLTSGCASGGYTVKTTTGSEIKFKEENVSCTSIPMRTVARKSVEFLEVFCNASGVLTDLTGRTRVYSKKEQCYKKSNKISCLAGKYFNEYSDKDFYYRDSQ